MFLGMVEIYGTMIDCQERLRTGDGMVVSLRFYLLKGAFAPIRLPMDDGFPILGFNEGQETVAET